jgi:hypothetical protein
MLFFILHDAFLQYRRWCVVSISSSPSGGLHLGVQEIVFPRASKNKKLSNIIRLYINQADVPPDHRPSPCTRSNESPAGGHDPPKAESSWDTVQDKHDVPEAIFPIFRLETEITCAIFRWGYM